LITACFAQTTPLRFISALRIPLVFKRLLVFTLSLVETFRHAIDRAHTALVPAIAHASNVDAQSHQWLGAGADGVADRHHHVVGRLRDKWPVENTLAQLDRALSEGEQTSLSRRDLVWLPIALATVILAIGTR